MDSQIPDGPMAVYCRDGNRVHSICRQRQTTCGLPPEISVAGRARGGAEIALTFRSHGTPHRHDHSGGRAAGRTMNVPRDLLSGASLESEEIDVLDVVQSLPFKRVSDRG